MGAKVEIAERLKELGYDPVETMTRIAQQAEANNNLTLAAKIASDLLEYTAPKLKSMEVAIAPDTRDFLMARTARLERIATLIRETGLAAVLREADGAVEVIDAQLLHTPDTQ